MIKILIADDDKFILNTLKNYLSSKNFTITMVSNGQSAYLELLKGIYDICLLDIYMPLESGFSILQKIKMNPKIYTAIIVMTGFHDRSHIITAMRTGADDYLAKPFKFDELNICLHKAFQSSKLRKSNIIYKNNLEKKVKQTILRLKKAYFDITNAFASAIEVRDPYTGGHSIRVSEISFTIGQAMHLSNEKLEEIRIGGLLHDIGKIGIPDKILNKPAKLNRKEYTLIMKHPQKGYDIIKAIKPILYAKPYILSHHERYDGYGYPRGLKGKKIPLEGRILAVADAFEAMTSSRPYRKAMSLKNAYQEIIYNQGKQFDPEVVHYFNNAWNKNKIQNILIKFQ